MKDTNLQIQAQDFQYDKYKENYLFTVILLKTKTERKSGKHPDEDNKQYTGNKDLNAS